MGYNYGQCKFCNKVIQYKKLPICEKCYDEKFQKVKAYIYENGESTVEEIRKATNLPLVLIEAYLEDNSLWIVEDKNEELKQALKEKQEKENKSELIKELKQQSDEYKAKKEREEEEKRKQATPRMRFLGGK